MHNQILPNRYSPNPDRKSQNNCCYTSWIVVAAIWAVVIGVVL